MAPLTLEILARALGEAGAGGVAVRDGSTVEGRLAAGELHALADRLSALGAECQFLAAADTRDRSGDFTLAYGFAPPALRPRALVLVPVDPAVPSFPSLATRSFAASRFEREIHDLFGLTPLGDFADAGQPFPFRRVEGEGIFEITVGPVHAGIIEPGHFRFSVEGETIVNLETRLGFVHK